MVAPPVTPHLDPTRGGCALCGGATTPDPAGERWKLFGAVYGLVRCERCGSSRSDPLPDDATLAQVYGAGGFDYGWYRQHYPAKLVDALARALELRRAGVLSGRRVLDFGGGVGYFSRAARMLGYDAMTWDPVLGTGPAPAERSFDAVVALHVLEHSNRIDETVARAARFLRPGGQAAFVVPNAASEGYRTRGSRWVWAQPPLIHVHHITAEGLRTLLERHGLEIVRVSYHDRWDANRASDVWLADAFAWLDRGWSRARWLRPLVAARNSALRYLALGAAVLRPAAAPARAEVEVIARLGAPK